MNGQILPGTPIAVDFWKIKGRKDCLVHFLTHVHGDHIVGLTSSWSRPIYCSELSAHILEHHYGVKKSCLNTLPLNQSTLVRQNFNTDDSFCVTAFEANHCPGAIILYFEGDFGNILHTGDFRYSPEMMSELRGLSGKIDKMYIDNTFCSPSCVFPTREECKDKIIDIALKHPDHDIVIGVRKLGKELLLAQLGVALNESIYVSPERYSISQQLLDSNVFAVSRANGNSQGRVRTVLMHKVSREMVYLLNQVTPTIAILPTAIYTGLPSKPFSNAPNIYLVPYSDHSSFPELVQFVNILRPKSIFPVVHESRGPFGYDISCRSDVSCLLNVDVNTPVPEIRLVDSSVGYLSSNTVEDSRCTDHLHLEETVSSSNNSSALTDESLRVENSSKYFSFRRSFDFVSSSECKNSVPLRKRKSQAPSTNRRKTLKTAKGVVFLETDDNTSDTSSNSDISSPQHKKITFSQHEHTGIYGKKKFQKVIKNCVSKGVTQGTDGILSSDIDDDSDGDVSTVVESQCFVFDKESLDQSSSFQTLPNQRLLQENSMADNLHHREFDKSRVCDDNSDDGTCIIATSQDFVVDNDQSSNNQTLPNPVFLQENSERDNLHHTVDISHFGDGSDEDTSSIVAESLDSTVHNDPLDELSSYQTLTDPGFLQEDSNSKSDNLHHTVIDKSKGHDLNQMQHVKQISKQICTHLDNPKNADPTAESTLNLELCCHHQRSGSVNTKKNTLNPECRLNTDLDNAEEECRERNKSLYSYKKLCEVSLTAADSSPDFLLSDNTEQQCKELAEKDSSPLHENSKNGRNSGHPLFRTNNSVEELRKWLRRSSMNYLQQYDESSYHSAVQKLL